MNQTSVQFFNSRQDPKLEKLRAEGKIIREIDLLEDCLSELFDIDHPWLKPGDEVFERTKAKYLDQWKKRGPLEEQGVWVYYPWLQLLGHFPDEDTYFRLRTSRNRNLITEAEQRVLQSKNIGVAGMSVGSNILNTLVLSGTAKHIKIADFDTISVPNLNRIMAPAHAVGMNKAVYFTQRSLEVDPFLDIHTYSEGLNEDQFEPYFTEPKLDLFIEEMDNPYLKIQSRKLAKKLGIPVIMAADNGDGVLIDVERFDQTPDIPLFHNRLAGINLDTISPNLTFSQKLAIIAKMAGLAEATPRMQDSIRQVGATLNTWPQLGTAAVMAGVALTFIARRILLGEPMPSGRYAIGLEEHLVKGYDSRASKSWRRKHTRKTMYEFRSFQDFIEEVSKL